MAHSLPGFAAARPDRNDLVLPPAPTSTNPITVDARGHRCPVPSLKLRKALDSVTAGRPVTLLADDPMARIDVPHMMSELGGTVLEIRDEDGWIALTVASRAETPG